MPAYHVVKSTSIHATKAALIQALSDFRDWPKWSPWLILEPATHLEFNDKQGEIGASYSWSGEMIGSGTMELTNMSDSRLEMRLCFIKPFRSTARVEFHLDMVGEHCNVSWHMFGNLPFYLFFLREKMKAWIGMDYERGLRMLRQWIEEHQVSSTTVIDGTTILQPQYYVGIRQQSTIADLGDHMKECQLRLFDLLDQHHRHALGPPFSIYHSIDIITSETDFIAAIPLAEPVVVDAPFLTGTLAGGTYFKVTHTGYYEYLGNAWALLMQVCRFRKLKTRKKPLGIERYLNDPDSTPPDKRITEVMTAMK